jgi:hypothetical protein
MTSRWRAAAASIVAATLAAVCYVEFPAQRDDNETVTFAGTQIQAEHGDAFLLQQQGEVQTQRQVHRYSL